MKLISCDECGTVLDGDKLEWPEEIYNYDGSINPRVAKWSDKHKDWAPLVDCPVCKSAVFKE